MSLIPRILLRCSTSDGVFLLAPLAWPDIISSISYLIKITEDMANAARLYAQLLEGRLTHRKYPDSGDTANSMVEVRSLLLFPILHRVVAMLRSL